MNLRSLITYLQKPSSPRNHGEYKKNPVSNLSHINEIFDHLQYLHNTQPDTFSQADALVALVTYNTLQKLCKGELDKTIDLKDLLTNFITATHKLRDEHYQPIAALESQAHAALSAEWDAKNTRYELLIYKIDDSPHYIDVLYEEFFSEGGWDRELDKTYDALRESKHEGNVVSITTSETKRKLRERFREMVEDEGTIFFDLRIPQSMLDINAKNNANNKRMHIAALNVAALTTLTKNLQDIIDDKKAEPANNAKILTFPARRAAQPRSQP